MYWDLRRLMISGSLIKKENKKLHCKARPAKTGPMVAGPWKFLSETTQGDFYKNDRSYNYYTAELYAGLFFTNGKVCGENNIVKGTSFDAKGKAAQPNIRSN